MNILYPLQNDQSIPVLGKIFQIEFKRISTAKSKIYIANNKIFVNSATPSEDLKKWLIEVSRKYITKKVIEFSKEFAFEYNQIRIKTHRSRWGSCSSKRNLNFNWQLIFMPVQCIDYVIIHELAHTKQMNHSKHFWAEVERCMPEYKIYQKQLRILEKRLVRNSAGIF